MFDESILIDLSYSNRALELDLASKSLPVIYLNRNSNVNTRTSVLASNRWFPLALADGRDEWWSTGPTTEVRSPISRFPSSVTRHRLALSHLRTFCLFFPSYFCSWATLGRLFGSSCGGQVVWWGLKLWLSSCQAVGWWRTLRKDVGGSSSAKKATPEKR